METVEIRFNKKRLVPMLLLLGIPFFGMGYYAFFSGKFESSNSMKLIYAVSTGLMIYQFYFPIKKLIRNEPVLTFGKTTLELREKAKAVTPLWQEITSWKIEKDADGGTKYLIIQTAEKAYKTNVSWLDKKPQEIEELLQAYKRH